MFTDSIPLIFRPPTHCQFGLEIEEVGFVRENVAPWYSCK